MFVFLGLNNISAVFKAKFQNEFRRDLENILSPETKQRQKLI